MSNADVAVYLIKSSIASTKKLPELSGFFARKLCNENMLTYRGKVIQPREVLRVLR